MSSYTYNRTKCGTVCRSLYDLKDHYRAYHLTKLHMGRECPRYYEIKEGLARHVKEAHASMVPCCIQNCTFEIESDRVSRMTKKYKLPTSPSSLQSCASGDSRSQLPAATYDSGAPWLLLLLLEDCSRTLFPNSPRRIASTVTVPSSQSAVQEERSDRHRCPAEWTPPRTSSMMGNKSPQRLMASRRMSSKTRT
jgi:hypothetical protein